jgi:hypothetical protein
MLGCAGFKDLNGNGRWWDDTHGFEGGLYELNEDDKRPMRRRSGPFIDPSESHIASTLFADSETGEQWTLVSNQ